MPDAQGDLVLVHRTSDGVEFYVSPGRKSPNDFRVHYLQPGKRLRTPKHIHLAVDILMKRVGNSQLTRDLIDHVLQRIISCVAPCPSFPPCLQVYSTHDKDRFRDLDRYGDYSAEFLLVAVELITIQERTNYPEGSLNRKLFELMRGNADIFSVVSAATFRGR